MVMLATNFMVMVNMETNYLVTVDMATDLYNHYSHH